MPNKLKLTFDITDCDIKLEVTICDLKFINI